MHFMLEHQKKLSQGWICCKLLKILLSLSLPHRFFYFYCQCAKFCLNPPWQVCFEIYEYVKFAGNNKIVVIISIHWYDRKTEKGHFVVKECCICLLLTDHFIWQQIINLVSGNYYANFVFWNEMNLKINCKHLVCFKL